MSNAPVRTYRQKQPQPQQNPRSGGWESSSDVRRYAEKFLSKLAQPVEHLKIMTDQLGKPCITIDEQYLKPQVTRALNELKSNGLSMIQIEKLVNALIISQGSNVENKVGLEALSVVWKNMFYGNKPLTGDILVRIGRVISNRGDFGTLQDMAGLVGYRAPGYLGLHTLDPNFDTVRPWIEPRSHGLIHLRGIAKAPSLEDLKNSPAYLEHLSLLRLAYDGSTRSFRPWEESRSPDFVDSLARLEAWWLSLMSNGLTFDKYWSQQSRDHYRWESWSNQIPELNQIDFSEVYPTTYQTLLSNFSALFLQYPQQARLHPLEQSAHAGVSAWKIAEQTLKQPEYREELFRRLYTQFTDPDAMSAYKKTPEFEHIVRAILLRKWQESPQIQSGWVKQELLENIWTLAQKDAEQATNISSLQALERLVTDKNRLGRIDPLLLQANMQEQKDNQFLQSIMLLGLRLGMVDPTFLLHQSSPPPEMTLHNAVLKRFANLPFQVDLKQDGATKVFVVTRNENSSAVSNDQIQQLMDYVCNEVNSRGYPTAWKFSEQP
jgi:hypothetical protein